MLLWLLITRTWAVDVVIIDGDVDVDADADADSDTDSDSDTDNDTTRDADDDGYTTLDDCNDADSSIYPGAAESIGDGIDQDCDGYDLVYCYFDWDLDGYGGEPLYEAISCNEEGMAWLSGDCDDVNTEIHPGAYEQPCDGIDSDCDGAIEDEDNDEDNYSVCDDCDDENPSIYPGSLELYCNGVDDDCNPESSDAPDNDGDGFSYCDDCDDADSELHPKATDVCGNGIDEDCNNEDAVCPDYTTETADSTAPPVTDTGVPVDESDPPAVLEAEILSPKEKKPPAPYGFGCSVPSGSLPRWLLLGALLGAIVSRSRAQRVC